jgi:hypothetical protein
MQKPVSTENKSQLLQNHSPSMYCARPGSWRATVLRTAGPTWASRASSVWMRVSIF